MQDAKHLSNLSFEELKALYNSNRNFAEYVDEYAQVDANIVAEDQFELVGARAFGVDSTSYAWYLLTPRREGTSAPFEVAKMLDEDYLDDNSKELYHKLNELYDAYMDTTDYDEMDRLKEEAEKVCDDLATSVHDMLVEYEDYRQYVDGILEQPSLFEDMVLNDDGSITQTITKTLR